MYAMHKGERSHGSIADHLPPVRVRAAKPFWSSGVDYAGSI